MGFPSRSQYAILAVYELSKTFRSARPTSAQTIADKYQLSVNFLIQILRSLRDAKLVETIRGAHGGYRLLIDPENVTLGYVVALTEDQESDASKNREDSKGKKKKSRSRSTRSRKRTEPDVRAKLEEIWQKAEAKRHEYFNGILFSDLISEPENEGVLDFMI